MRVILCDAKVAKLGGWVKCPEQTSASNTDGWTLGRSGDFCPEHTRLTAGRAA
ncbi:hypothetical protein QE428_002628 [Microbacterium sp. SORGH_AS 505]|uniref:hypothetical protein n=1 Tax=Microbacterium sp. SORGH_AS_0505 TaxID=3041770 RepID=UPI00277FDC12|nr:hypothetical protein [Microbacterium sp. SORGH_AS_0505]MDQ1127595.1 hypothetical protein [Microbacterium sp. SORGH_AS_0505]